MLTNELFLLWTNGPVPLEVFCNFTIEIEMVYSQYDDEATEVRSVTCGHTGPIKKIGALRGQGVVQDGDGMLFRLNVLRLYTKNAAGCVQ